MEQLTTKTPTRKASDRIRPLRKAARIAFRCWRAASMLDRLIDILGWIQG